MNATESISWRIIAVLMENEAGALARGVGLFAQRGYNIDTLTVAPTEDASLSRLTISIGPITEDKIDQLCKQLNRLVCVYKVIEAADTYIARELMLIKVHADTAVKRNEIKNIVEIFGGKILDVTPTSYVFQIVGKSSKINAVLGALSGFTIIEIDRSGLCGLGRGTRAMSNG